MKKKSPKVYKVKTGNTKSSSVHNVLSAVVMIAAAGLVGFVGYSIAKPFIQDDAATSDSSLQMNAAVTTQATEAATTAETTTATTADSSGSFDRGTENHAGNNCNFSGLGYNYRRFY